jgi:hypothetical protein
MTIGSNTIGALSLLLSSLTAESPAPPQANKSNEKTIIEMGFPNFRKCIIVVSL